MCHSVRYLEKFPHLITLSDDRDRCHILAYAIYKSRRVTRSVLGAKVYAFADSFYLAYALRVGLESIAGSKIPLHMYTDSKSLFHVITKNSSILEKRLMIDIASTREAYKRGDIAQIGHVRSEHNSADSRALPPSFQEAKQFKHLLQRSVTRPYKIRIRFYI